MAISFVGLLEGQKGLAAEQAAAAKAQEDSDWRKLIRQDGLDAKSQAQANFESSVLDKRYEIFSKGVKAFGDARKPSGEMLASIAYLKDVVGETEGGDAWLDSFKNNPAMLKKIEDAHRKAVENGNPVEGNALVANILVINSSEDPDAAVEEFATSGDLWAQAGEIDFTDREAFYDLYSQTQVAPKAPTSTFRIKDPQALGMALPGGKDYEAQSKLYEKEVNKRMTNRFQELTTLVPSLPANTPERRAADAELVKVTNAKNGSQNNNDTLRDQLFGDSAWDYLAGTYESNPQMFGNGAFPRPGGPAPVETPTVREPQHGDRTDQPGPDGKYRIWDVNANDWIPEDEFQQ
jgi:hypothetical protein